MSQSYQSKDSGVQQVQLKVQEVCLKLSDNQVMSSSGSQVTIDLQESISEIRSAIFIDDSASTAAPVVAANRSVSGNQVVLTLSAPMAAEDCIDLKYVVSQ